MKPKQAARRKLRFLYGVLQLKDTHIAIRAIPGTNQVLPSLLSWLHPENNQDHITALGQGKAPAHASTRGLVVISKPVVTSQNAADEVCVFVGEHPLNKTLSVACFPSVWASCLAIIQQTSASPMKSGCHRKKRWRKGERGSVGLSDAALRGTQKKIAERKQTRYKRKHRGRPVLRNFHNLENENTSRPHSPPPPKHLPQRRIAWKMVILGKSHTSHTHMYSVPPTH